MIARVVGLSVEFFRGGGEAWVSESREEEGSQSYYWPQEVQNV